MSAINHKAMRYIIFFNFFMAFSYVNSLAQLPEGNYAGAFSRDGSVQLLHLSVSDTKPRYDIPELGLFDLEPENIFRKGDTLNIKLYYGNFFCFIDERTGDITGISEKWEPSIRLHLKRVTATAEKKYMEEEVVFYNKKITLAGTLLKPATIKEAIPYVVLVHGSDYQDRNTPYYHSLGYALASNGIGVLLYDKRGCGGSGGNWESASLFDLAEDAVAALNYLAQREDLAVSRTGLLGTSQGGWVATVAAEKFTRNSFLILNVGPAVSTFEQDLHRVKYSMLEDGWKQAVIDSAIAYTQQYFKYVKSNAHKDWEALQILSASVKTKKWADYLSLPDGPKDKDILWWRGNDFDPAGYLKKLRCPVLSFFGEKDVLVPPQENSDKMDELLRIAGIKYRILTLENCGHDLRTYQGMNGDSWQWPVAYWQWRRQPDIFIKTIIAWILEQ